MTGVACFALADGSPRAVSTSEDKTLRVWAPVEWGAADVAAVAAIRQAVLASIASPSAHALPLHTCKTALAAATAELAAAQKVADAAPESEAKSKALEEARSLVELAKSSWEAAASSSLASPTPLTQTRTRSIDRT